MMTARGLRLGPELRRLWTHWIWPLWKLATSFLLLWVVSWVLYLLLLTMFSADT